MLSEHTYEYVRIYTNIIFMLLIRKTWWQWVKKPFSGAVVFLCSFIYINESFNFRTIKKDNANLEKPGACYYE